MAKQSGLGANFYVGGYDLSGDVGSVGRIASPRGTTDVTGINKSAPERLLTTKDGGIDFTAWFNKTGAHPVLKTLPYSDVQCTYAHRATAGAPAACCIAKQVSYDPTRNADGSLSFAVSTQANGYGLEWGNLLTDGLVSLTATGNGTAVQLPGMDTAYAYMPSGAGNYFSTPDTASLDVAGDLDIAAQIAMDDWSPAVESTPIAKYTTTGNQRSYALVITTSGGVALLWSEDGTAQKSASSTTNLISAGAVTELGGGRLWVRATLDVDNGASGYSARFYYGTDGTTWTQLGSTVTAAGVTSIFNSTAILEIGSRTGGTTNPLIGKFYQGWVKNGIDGTFVARPIINVDGTITDATGKTWTKNGTVTYEAENRHGLQAYLHVISFTGTSATISVQRSRDNTTWATLTDLDSTVTTAPYTNRVATTTQRMERYTRYSVAGTFTQLTFALVVVPNELDGVVF